MSKKIDILVDEFDQKKANELNALFIGGKVRFNRTSSKSTGTKELCSPQIYPQGNTWMINGRDDHFKLMRGDQFFLEDGTLIQFKNEKPRKEQFRHPHGFVDRSYR